MTRPYGTLLWMLVTLGMIAAAAGLVQTSLREFFAANAAFNGVIAGVLAVGVVYNLRQVLALAREARWIERFRRSDPERPLRDVPRLLAPMARMLAQRERGELSLSPLSLRSLLDSIRARLDESRDISRYLVGLLIFLGLLGTFWGLLTTVSSVSDIIAGMTVQGGDAVATFQRLKQGLQEPLAGMGVAFSSSLFGLAGSLVLGFLDLQAGHAQNRFFNELEEWLSSATRLPSGALSADGEAGVPAYVQALLEQTADGLERLQRSMAEAEDERGRFNDRLRALTEQLGQLNQHLGAEQRQLQYLADAQIQLKPLLEQLNAQQGGDRLSEELRAELRLLNRTIAAAMGRDARTSGD